MGFSKLATEIWRAFVVDGVAGSGLNPPSKPDLIVWGTELEDRSKRFEDGRAFADVRLRGAIGNGTTDDTTVFQNAINAVSALGGGVVYVPPGNYSLIGGITIPSNVNVVGAETNSTVLQAWHTDVSVVTMTGQGPGLFNLTVFGKGLNNDTGTFGAVNSAVFVSSIRGQIRDCMIWGGGFSLFCSTAAVDNYFVNIDFSNSYDAANIATSGANWYIRCKIDHSPTGVTPTTAQPYPARANSTAYTVGQIRTLSGYAIQCVSAGTSGGSAPALKNYLVNITDGTATWQLWAKVTYAAVLVGTSAGENNFYNCDLSGPTYTTSIEFSAGTPASVGPRVTFFTNCVLGPGGNAVSVTAGEALNVNGCEIGGNIVINSGYTGIAMFKNNYFTGAYNITVAANVQNFMISDNWLHGGTITTSGTSNHYSILGNGSCTVSDGASGANKAVANNFA